MQVEEKDMPIKKEIARTTTRKPIHHQLIIQKRRTKHIREPQQHPLVPLPSRAIVLNVRRIGRRGRDVRVHSSYLLERADGRAGVLDGCPAVVGAGFGERGFLCGGHDSKEMVSGRVVGWLESRCCCDRWLGRREAHRVLCTKMDK